MTPARRLVYVTNARLPTEKAHGYQMVKMCEAIAHQGLDVQLWHPFYPQQAPALSGQSVFEYYGVPPVFQVCAMRNFNILKLERYFSNAGFMPVFASYAFLWAHYAARLARREKADLYYTREPVLAFWLARMGLPTVYEAHTLHAYVGRWQLKLLRHNPALSAVAAVTNRLREDLAGLGIPADKIIVLPDGVDLDMFSNLPGQKECRSHLGLPPDRRIIGYVGRFHTMEMEKGIPDLIRAMAHLVGFGEKEPLLSCVGGPMEAVPAYLAEACNAGIPEERLIFTDRVPNSEVPIWLRALDVAVMPFPNIDHYAHYMSPLKLFEYMAAGLPIVASDLPALREVLRHGENAWLVPPGNPVALAEGISFLLEDQALAAALGGRAALDARRYAWDLRAASVL